MADTASGCIADVHCLADRVVSGPVDCIIYLVFVKYNGSSALAKLFNKYGLPVWYSGDLDLTLFNAALSNIPLHNPQHLIIVH
jgi:hypothetical protein